MNTENNIIFTIARMNPPTPGHLLLIEKMILKAIDLNTNQIFVILSKSNDNDENPISCPEKINVLGNVNDITKTMIQTLKQKMINESINLDSQVKSKIENIAVYIICVPEQKGATPFTPIIPIIKNTSNAKLILIIGEDRKNLLDSITDFFLKWENVYSVDGVILPREEMNEYKIKSKNPLELDKLDISKVPVNAISASFVRNIVKNQRRDKFTELYSSYLDESKIQSLYENILDGVNNLPANTKSEPPKKQLKYKYPMIKNSTATANVNANTYIKTSKRKRDTFEKTTMSGGGKSRKQRKLKQRTNKQTKIIKSRKNKRNYYKS